MQSDPSLVEVKIGALIMDPNTNTPIVVLKGVDSEAVLPIWVGAFEANAIALEIEKVAPQRPMTHDLLRNVIIECGLLASSVVVTDLAENTFYARIELLDKKG
ncbi:MAG TPA: bifunctional nuclease family protein, partial [Pyrinomonadaceae bacterium]|nr:bifunctional nuclease family protein [Pyrinomonadaceae bacterium]